MKRWAVFCLTVTLLFSASAVVDGAEGGLRLPSVFSDHMVLQRDIPVPVWGRATPGSLVTVEFAGQRKTAEADPEGAWRIVLDPLLASAEPRELTVLSSIGNQKSEIIDVLVGEVWICSGQSNMYLPLVLSERGKESIDTADIPNLRLLMITPRKEDSFLQTLRVETSAMFPSNYVPVSTPRFDFRGQWAPSQAGSGKVKSFSGAAFYFGRRLCKELGVPVGLIQMAEGGTPAESWVSEKQLQSRPEFGYIYERQALWEKNREQYRKKFETEALAPWRVAASAASAGEKKPQPPYPPKELRPNWMASSLYNALVFPLSSYAMRGVIWYQGESNTEKADRYQLLFSALIADWRQLWGQGNFPFYFVQLPNYGSSESGLALCPWAELREAQLETHRSVENTGMAVTIDIGEAGNVHPANKHDVGNRLALWALNNTYGRKDLVCSGPLYRSAEFLNDRIVLHFDYVGGGLTVPPGESLGSVEIADAKGLWHSARGGITNDTVVVWHDAVSCPQGVRYAWAGNPEHANLYNRERLPASPFQAVKNKDK
ncbi:MAG: sialate O-acetylesterase [Kiritimatiellales bacterium]